MLLLKVESEPEGQALRVASQAAPFFLASCSHSKAMGKTSAMAWQIGVGVLDRRHSAELVIALENQLEAAARASMNAARAKGQAGITWAVSAAWKGS